MQETKQKKDHFLVGLMIGASLGTIMGLLYAPNEGKITRKKLTFKLKKTREQLQEYIKKLTEGRIEHINSAKTKGEQVISEAKTKAENLLKDVESLMQQIKTK